MHAPIPQRQTWSPNVNALRCSYDKIEIVSSAFPGYLWKKLPIKQLRGECHSFGIEEIDHRYYHSRIVLVCTPNGRALNLLKQAESCLLSYAVIVAEVAADARAPSADMARANHLASIKTVSKRRHVRGYVDIQFDKNKKPPPGIISGPTIYYEHGSSSMAFKSYCRYDKAAFGQFTAQPVTHFEWTLKGSAIKTHLGGKQIDDLLNANLRTFVGTHLNLERVDHAAVGKLLDPKVARPHDWPFDDPDFWARQAAFRAIRFTWYKATAKCRKCSRAGPCGKHEWALWAWQHSPAHVRGFLRSLKSASHRPITPYRIGRCFY